MKRADVDEGNVRSSIPDFLKKSEEVEVEEGEEGGGR